MSLTPYAISADQNPIEIPIETPGMILDYLRVYGPSSAPTIAKGLGTSAPTVTKHLRRAAIKGLVEQTGVKWELSFAGLSALPGTPDEDALTAAAVTAEMDFAGEIELWRRLVKNAIASLGRARADDPEELSFAGRPGRS